MLTGKTDTVRTQPGREDLRHKHPGNWTPTCTVADHEEVDCKHVSHTIMLSCQGRQRSAGPFDGDRHKGRNKKEGSEHTARVLASFSKTTDFFRIVYLMATIAVLAWLTPVAPGTGG
jgi:hypothetical protein